MSDLQEIRSELEEHAHNAEAIRDELEIVGLRLRQLRRTDPEAATTEQAEPAGYWDRWRVGARRGAERIRPDGEQGV